MPSRMAQASRYEDGSRAGLQARPGELGRPSLYQKRSSTWADHPSPRPSEISNSHRECRSSCRGPEVPRRQPPPSAEGTPGAHRLWPGTQQRATLTTMRVQSVADATVVSLGSRNKTPTRQSLLRTPNAPVYEQSARSKCSPRGHPFSDGPKGSIAYFLRGAIIGWLGSSSCVLRFSTASGEVGFIQWNSWSTSPPLGATAAPGSTPGWWA